MAMLAVAMLAGALSSADEVILKNGRKIQVKSYKKSGRFLVVELRNGRTRRIPNGRVASITMEGEQPPASAKAPGRAPAKKKAAAAGKVFTNTDLPSGGDGEGRPAAKRSNDRESRQVERQANKEEKKWDAWHLRYLKLQAHIDAAGATLDELEARGDAVSGDIQSSSDGQQISGVRPGRGHYWRLERAKEELQHAQSAMDILRDEAKKAGVPPGVLR